MKMFFIAAAMATCFCTVSMTTVASAQSRGWQMKQGIYCPDGTRARNIEVCNRRAARAAKKKM